MFDEAHCDTFVIQIGNSDNRLSQAEWSRFCTALRRVITGIDNIAWHFQGASQGDFLWQNYCLVIQVPECWPLWFVLENSLSELAKEFKQDSIAITKGLTTFIKPPNPAKSGKTGKPRTKRKTRK